jgi:N-acetyl-gamma-glutamyl-phosphate reductase
MCHVERVKEMKAAIIGATGYGGIELLRLLSKHPYVQVVSVHSSSQAGVPLQHHYPHILKEADFILDEIDPEKIAKNADIVFLGTPAGISSKLTPQFFDLGVTVIDLSGDFRLKNQNEYEQWYKKTPPPPEYLKHAVYGLAEWNREEIADAKIIANPGCYPTASLLGLIPLVKQKIIRERSIIIDAKSGVSGAGRTPSLTTHFTEINDNLKIYKVNQHQHIPEIEQELCKWDENLAPVTFSTHLVPMTRGIMATIYAEAKVNLTTDDLLDLYHSSYEGTHFVRIREKGTFPSTKEVSGSNFCDIGVDVDARTGRVTVVSVIDNLMKGAAGQALQNLNIMMGIDENTGLDQMPIYP